MPDLPRPASYAAPGNALPDLADLIAYARARGDLIICTRNDHTTEAGVPGRALANGDLLRIEGVTREGLIVRRALDADPRTGQRRWTDRRFGFNCYENSELG